MRARLADNLLLGRAGFAQPLGRVRACVDALKEVPMLALSPRLQATAGAPLSSSMYGLRRFPGCAADCCGCMLRATGSRDCGRGSASAVWPAGSPQTPCLCKLCAG